MSGRRKTEPYAEIAVSLPWHRKVCENIEPKDAPAAFGLHVAGICFCQEKRTDGRILKSQLPAVLPMTDKDRARLSALLVNAGLWHEDGAGGYLIHDYLEHNKSREEIESLSQKRAGAGAVGGSKSRSKTASKSAPVALHLATPTTTTASTTATTPSVFESESDSKTSPSSPCRSVPVDNSVNVPDDVVGYFTDKVGHDPNPAELHSLRTLVRNFGGGITKTAIGQAVIQGQSPANFALVTTIAKAEVS